MGVGSSRVAVGDGVAVLIGVDVPLGEGEDDGMGTVGKGVAVRELHPVMNTASHPKQTSQEREGGVIVLIRITLGIISIVSARLFSE